jgi:TRAP-type C4-dicarboxylate transport system permease small subunit
VTPPEPTIGPGTPAGPLVRSLERLSRRVNRVLALLAGVGLGAMMLFAVSDMVLRGFGITVAGSYEVIGWLSAGAMALALGTVQQERGHVAMELLVVRLAPGLRAAVELVMGVLSLLLFVALAWYVARYARVLQDTGSLSETLRVIVYPWVYVVAAGGVGLALALLVDVLRLGGQCATLMQRRR